MHTKRRRRFVVHFIATIALWLILTGGDPKTWWFGLPTSAIAAGISWGLLKEPWSWSLKGLMRFIPFFIHQSLIGGIDVAVRALHPRMPLEPAIVSYSLRLPEGPASVFIAGMISLLPGTLTAELKGSSLQVHVIDVGLPVTEKLRMLEERVGNLFGIVLRQDNS